MTAPLTAPTVQLRHGQLVSISTTLTTAAGAVLSTSYSFTVTLGDPMQVGVDFDATSKANAVGAAALFPGATAPVRVFARPGAGLPAVTRADMTYLRGAGLTPWPSHKDMPTHDQYLAWVTALLSMWPTGKIRVTYRHEMDDDTDITPDVYRTNTRQLAAWLDELDPALRARVLFTPIHNLYWINHKNGGNWQTWDAGVGDEIGFDVYEDLGAAAAGYTRPEQMLATPFAAARATGRTLAVAEMGALRKAFDTDGSQRAGWMTGMATSLRQFGASTVAFWYSTGPQGNFQFPDPSPELTAWRREITGG